MLISMKDSAASFHPSPDSLEDTDYQRLTSLLWEYRTHFERLEFLLDTQILLIAAGRDRHLHHLVDLIGEVQRRFDRLDLEREVFLGSSTDGFGPLSEIASDAPDPWATILGEHADALMDHVRQTQALSDHCRALIQSVQAQLPDVVTLLNGQPSGPTAGTYGQQGRRQSDPSTAVLFENRV